LQRAGARLAQAERQLARLGSRATSGARTAAVVAQSPREAPVLTSSGQTLSWSRVAGMSTYVFVRKVPGQPDQYSVVTGTSITPPAVPGATVRYAVRTTAWWSSWSAERAIAYPGAGEGGKAPNPQAAPSVTVSGQTISWNSVAGVGAYVLVRKVPGLSDVYSEVNGTSVTPPVAPGKNVRYSVRTAVEHSAWAPEVAIAYPASTPPPVSPPPPVTPPVEEPVTPPPAEEGHEGSSRTMIGLDIGGWAWESAINDEAGAVRYVRSSYKHFNSDSQMALLAKAGVKLLPLFGEGGTLASYDNAAFVGEIVSWFKRYGKGGTFWAGRPVDLGATTAELINEPGNPYFYPDYANHRLYAEITKAVHSALEANFAAAVRPKLLVSYDGGFNGSEYGRAIFAAGAVADGVTVHPYGGHGSGSAGGNRERVVQAHSETGLPVYVTEVGWPTGLGLLPTGDSLQWSEQQQAVNLSDFIKWARAQGYVEDVTYFNYADYGINDFYGIVHSDGSGHKLSYGVLKAATAAS
ncbi:MAG: hypothetical protein H0X28_12255, partial [Solirubrobacterales bacterium]|nr:hypothetical protein [Solirubrobacterales bacterium]